MDRLRMFDVNGQPIRVQLYVQQQQQTPHKQPHSTWSQPHIYPHRCYVCLKGFQTNNALEQHNRDKIHHTGQFQQLGVQSLDFNAGYSAAPAAHCYLCQRDFNSVSALEQHTEDKHGTSSYTRCDVCGREFNAVISLEQHRTDRHGVGSFWCHVCQRVFNTNSALAQHQRDKHPSNATVVNVLVCADLSATRSTTTTNDLMVNRADRATSCRYLMPPTDTTTSRMMSSQPATTSTSVDSSSITVEELSSRPQPYRVVGNKSERRSSTSSSRRCCCCCM